MIKHNVAQGSKQWLEARLGLPTASCADRILTPEKLILSSQAVPYRNQLLAEWALGTVFETELRIYSTAIDDGIQREADAAEYFSLITGLTTSECGFVTDDLRRWGASPDRWTSDGALLEIKSPTAPIHCGYLLEGVLPKSYRLQVAMQLLVTECPHAWFLSYYPGLPSLLLKIEPDPRVQAALHAALALFCDQLDEAKARLEEMRS